MSSADIMSDQRPQDNDIDDVDIDDVPFPSQDDFVSTLHSESDCLISPPQNDYLIPDHHSLSHQLELLVTQVAELSAALKLKDDTIADLMRRLSVVEQRLPIGHVSRVDSTWQAKRRLSDKQSSSKKPKKHRAASSRPLHVSYASVASSASPPVILPTASTPSVLPHPLPSAVSATRSKKKKGPKKKPHGEHPDVATTPLTNDPTPATLPATQPVTRPASLAENRSLPPFTSATRIATIPPPSVVLPSAPSTADVPSPSPFPVERNREYEKDQVLIVHGVPEVPNLTDAAQVHSDIQFLTKVFLGILPEDCSLDLRKVQRLGSRDPSRARPLRLIFRSAAQRTLAFMNRAQLRTEFPSVFFHLPMSRAERLRFAALREELKLRRTNGEVGLVIRDGKIVNKTRSFLWYHSVTIRKGPVTHVVASH